MARVTVVNDNDEFLALVRDILEEERDDVTTIDGDRADALAEIRGSRPDVLMIDLHLGSDELHGWDIAQKIRSDPAFEGLPVLLCSADVVALGRLDRDLEKNHRIATLQKPFGLSQLTAAIDQLITTRGPASQQNP